MNGLIAHGISLGADILADPTSEDSIMAFLPDTICVGVYEIENNWARIGEGLWCKLENLDIVE
jgi:hypothetical protein